jgi:hypothetical protein
LRSVSAAGVEQQLRQKKRNLRRRWITSGDSSLFDSIKDVLSSEVAFN